MIELLVHFSPASLANKAWPSSGGSTARPEADLRNAGKDAPHP